jgi:hypothetical protein
MTSIKKTLIYYWYVHSTGWQDLYDLHISNLKIYKDVFDKEIFIISRDDDTNPEYVSAVIDKLRSIFPDAEFKAYKNDKTLRESCYFYNEIATKLQDYPDEWYFFAHNKGVDTYYTSKENCKDWICGMYFMNLNFMDSIETNMNLKDTCVIGTYLIRGVKQWSFLKYNWHFSGTFWWFNPSRVYKVMKENNNEIPSNNRYFTEGFFGSVIPDDEKYRRPSLMVYYANWRKGITWMPERLKSCYCNIYDNVAEYKKR